MHSRLTILRLPNVAPSYPKLTHAVKDGRHQVPQPFRYRLLVLVLHDRPNCSSLVHHVRNMYLGHGKHRVQHMCVCICIRKRVCVTHAGSNAPFNPCFYNVKESGISSAQSATLQNYAS